MKDKMELLWGNITNYSKKNGFSIYYSTDVDIVISFEWDKRMGSATKFLKNARNNGIKSIVLSIKRFEDEDMDCSTINCKKYTNKISEIDIMYINNDVGYKYHEEAEWFTELNTFSLDDLLEDNDEKKILPLTREVNEKSIDTLVQDMLQYFKNNISENINGDMDIDMRNFWMNKGVNLDFPVDQDLKLKIDKVNREVRRKLDNNKQSEEREKLLKLIPSVINETLRDKDGIITRDQLKSYLLSHGIKIQNSHNIDYMYNQLLKELRIKNKKY
ncbi:hypothetical protein [Ferroplasma sp.]|uniref:hypothetical protein n=1 Tax=Ferroplasma sp. TaxID=2591003 RepID=UPI00307CED80